MKNIFINACFALLPFFVCEICPYDASSEEESEILNIPKRYKRYLVYPGTAPLIELVTGFGIPITVDYQSLTMSSIIYYVYYLPYNGSQYTTLYTVYQKREIKTPSRWDIYDVFRQAIERFGFDGYACLLRAICEAAKYSTKEDNGLLGELLHLFLTPSTTNEVHRHTSEPEYRSAEQVGLREDSNCQVLYPECSLSFLDLISELSLD